jgi:hypothetical protein
MRRVGIGAFGAGSTRNATRAITGLTSSAGGLERAALPFRRPETHAHAVVRGVAVIC